MLAACSRSKASLSYSLVLGGVTSDPCGTSDISNSPAAQKADDGRTDNSQNSQYSQPVDEEAVDFETPLHSQRSRCPYPELEHGSLREAMESLDADRDFLKAGGVFDDDQIDGYIDLKMEEVLAFEMHPHPVEFEMYYKV